MLQQANSLFVLEDYQTARENYEEYLSQNEEDIVARANLALCYIKLRMYKEAELQCQRGSELNNDYYRFSLYEGICYFSQQKFQLALELFQKSAQINPEKSAIWIRKTQAEINRLRKLSSLKEPYTWYQSSDFIFVDILIKQAPEVTPQVQFTQNSFEVSATQSNGSDFLLQVDLMHEINTEESQFESQSHKITLKLKKLVQQDWQNLTVSVQSAQPSKTYTSKRDWNKVERALEAELKQEKPEGEAALHSLFREIFANGDEDTRRAMIKSFQTSGGTVLSTNWSEVAEKDYEGRDRPSPPRGQQWAPKS